MNDSSELTAINMDTLAELGINFTGNIEDIDSTLDILKEDLANDTISNAELPSVQESQPHSTAHPIQYSHTESMSSGSTIKLAGFAVDPSLHSTTIGELNKTSIQTWHTTFTETNDDKIHHEASQSAGDTIGSVTFDNVAYELCVLKTFHAWCKIKKQILQVPGYIKLSGGSKICLFVHTTKKASIPENPDDWKNVQISFLPNKNQPLYCHLEFENRRLKLENNRSELSAYLPSTLERLMSLIWEKSTFVLSSERLSNMPNYFMKIHKVDIFALGSFKHPNKGYIPLVLQVRMKAFMKIKKAVQLNHPNLGYIAKKLEEHAAYCFKKLICGNKIIVRKEVAEYEHIVDFYISKLSDIALHLNEGTNPIENILAFYNYKPMFGSNHSDQLNYSQDVSSLACESIMDNTDEPEDSNEVQIINYDKNINKPKSESSAEPLLRTEFCEALPSTTNVSRMKELLQGKLGSIFCTGCNTDFINGNLTCLYQHPLKHIELSEQIQSRKTMGCAVCKITFPSTDILELMKMSLSHITYGCHWMNYFKFSKSQNLMPYDGNNYFIIQQCEICPAKCIRDKGKDKKNIQHFRSKEHIESLKIMNLYLTYCEKLSDPKKQLGITPFFMIHLNTFLTESLPMLLRWNCKSQFAIDVICNFKYFNQQYQPIYISEVLLTKSVAAFHQTTSTRESMTSLPYPMFNHKINELVTKCTLCDCKFNHATNLLIHLINIHSISDLKSSTKSTDAIVCSQIIDTRLTLAAELDPQNKLPSRCPAVFQDYFSFCVHSDIHKTKEEFIKSCAGCNKIYTTKFNYYTQDECIRYFYHFKFSKPQNIGDLFLSEKYSLYFGNYQPEETCEGNETNKNISNETPKDIIRQCPNCKIHFPGNIRDDIINNHLQKCSSKESHVDIQTTDSFDQVSPFHPTRPKCRLCSMTFSSSWTLKRHVARCVTTWTGSTQQNEPPSTIEQEISNQHQTSSFDVDVLVPALGIIETMQEDDTGIEQMHYGGSSTNESKEVFGSRKGTYYYLCLDCEKEQGNAHWKIFFCVFKNILYFRL